MWRRQFTLKFFAQNILKENITNIYFHKFSVEDHLHEHYCTFEQLVSKTLVEIEPAVAKQTKDVRFYFFQNILSEAIFYHRQRDI